MLIWLLPLAPDATKVMVWPFTEMVSPAEKPVWSESVPAGPDSAVAPVTGTLSLLLATLPIAVLVLKKSLPAATAEAASSDVLASVLIDEFSAVLRFAAVAAGVAPIVKLPVGGG